MVAGRITALEAAVDDVLEVGFGAERLDARGQRRRAARTTVGSDVEVGQVAGEEARDL